MSEQALAQAKPHSIQTSLTSVSHGIPQRCSNGVECEECRKKRESSLQRDPMARTYTGSVNEYIERFAGASSTALQSPTQQVSMGQLDAALRWIKTNGAANLSLNNNGIGVAPSDFGLRWEVISGNYEILLVGPQPTVAAPSLQSAPGLLNWVVGWYTTTLTNDQKQAFRSVLVGITTSFSASRSRRTRLAKDVLNRVPRNP